MTAILERRESESLSSLSFFWPTTIAELTAGDSFNRQILVEG
jgi:hypothetical protein